MHRFKNLTNTECIKAYASDFVADRKDVVLVVEPLMINDYGSLVNGDGNDVFAGATQASPLTDENGIADPSDTLYLPFAPPQAIYNDTRMTLDYDPYLSASPVKPSKGNDHIAVLYAYQVYKLELGWGNWK